MRPVANVVRCRGNDVRAAGAGAAVHSESPAYGRLSRSTRGRETRISLINHPPGAVLVRRTGSIRCWIRVHVAVVHRRWPGTHPIGRRSEPAFEGERNARVRIIGAHPGNLSGGAATVAPMVTGRT